MESVVGANSDRLDRGSESTSIVVRLADQLREEIVSGTLQPGQRIRQEELAHRAGVSRVPVREALRSLAGEGLVTLIPNVGARVASLEPEELNEIYVIREHLEPAALGHSIPHLTLSQLSKLTELHTFMVGMDGSDNEMEVDRFLDIDREFHILMATAGPMKRLNALVREMINAAQPYRRAFTLTDPERVLRTTNDEHHLILDAVRHGEVSEAATLLGLHIRRTRQTLSVLRVSHTHDQG